MNIKNRKQWHHWLAAGLLFLWGITGLSAAEQGLGRTWICLAKEKKLVIGYFGGSITAGTGASASEKTSWRALTTDWFRKQFPNATIYEINAASGGTDSDLGAYRCQLDLLSKHPDLVFVEFVVNDFWLSEEKETASIEGIIRQIWKCNSHADIVLVYTANKTLADNYDKGSDPQTVVFQQRVANYYGIPTINIGKLLCQYIQEGKGTWESLTKDGTHPLDAGYALYAEGIQAFLETHRHDADVKPVSQLPAALSSDPLEKTQMIDAWEITAPGWDRQDSVSCLPFKHALSAGSGAVLDYSFTGSAVGLYWLVAPDSGDIAYSIDDGPTQMISSWDKYAMEFTRSHPVSLAEKLTAGSHVLHLKVLPAKPNRSNGNQVRIGAFLVH